ncbi:hypothetical protein [Marinobacter sp. ELB17]|uniref:hypothetical protein n=1 Tax=Marinobacter sp. ELB17 TaxID=270374 RepID=UPI0000F38EA9|nr:hypothetical protein [Marinobacter sp. ELB17]EBA01085.1 hypothetical protein MELB17_18569 [Marinobacter sp. ELB17]
MRKHSSITIRSGKVALLAGLAIALGGCASSGERPGADLQSAESVRNALENQGISSRRVESKGYDEQYPGRLRN